MWRTSGCSWSQLILDHVYTPASHSRWALAGIQTASGCSISPAPSAAYSLPLSLGRGAIWRPRSTDGLQWRTGAAQRFPIPAPDPTLHPLPTHKVGQTGPMEACKSTMPSTPTGPHTPASSRPSSRSCMPAHCGTSAVPPIPPSTTLYNICSRTQALHPSHHRPLSVLVCT